MSAPNKITRRQALNKTRQATQDSPDADPVKVYITELSDEDILLGRGYPVRDREANRRFRELVWRYKHAYESTGKHAVKNRIAREILGIVFGKGGRFVRRIEADEDRRAFKVPKSVAEAWVVVSEEVAREKCKQALRDSVHRSPPIKARERATNVPQQKPKCTDGQSQIKQMQLIPWTRVGQANATKNSAPATGQNLQTTVSNAVPQQSLHRDQHFFPSTMMDDDELSFRLKHPSHRKRYLLRLRHLQKDKEHSSGGSSISSAPTTHAKVATMGIPDSEDYPIVASAQSQPDMMDKINDDRSISNASSSTSDDSVDEHEIDRKPRGLKKVQR